MEISLELEFEIGSRESATRGRKQKKLTKQVEAKEALLTKELDNLVNKKKELVETKLMLGKFNTGNNKLDEIIVTSRRDPEKNGLWFIDTRKTIKKSPTMSTKGSTQGKTRERSTKVIMIKINKKVPIPSKIICNYYGTTEHIRPRCFKMLHIKPCSQGKGYLCLG